MIIRTGFADDGADTYYYESGKRTYIGLTIINGDYYYVNGNCKMIKGKTYYITRTNGLIEKSVYATFGEDGKLISFGK